MKMGKTLQTPLALVLQGFAMGAVLFFTLDPFAATAPPPPPPPAGESILAGVEA